MASSPVCDICGKPCRHIVGKLFIAPVRKGETRRTATNYTSHADIGECCAEKMATEIRWQKRRSVPRKTKTSIRRVA